MIFDESSDFIDSFKGVYDQYNYITIIAL